MEYLVEFIRRFFTNIYRTMKANFEDDVIDYDHIGKEKAKNIQIARR
jgi:hypothetical protein